MFSLLRALKVADGITDCKCVLAPDDVLKSNVKVDEVVELSIGGGRRIVVDAIQPVHLWFAALANPFVGGGNEQTVRSFRNRLGLL